MTQIQLRIYYDPSECQVFCNIARKDGTLEKLTATIDTGAAVSLFPRELLDLIAYRPTDDASIIIDQAGIAKQSFQAVEAVITISLEDAAGNLTQPFEITAWFTDTETRLIGFKDVLDQSILHIDMPQRSGWLEIDK
ncbi:MAG: hypothetical protein K8L97_18080 [Anaerolineae bacterium]|nr:hypothetical protein [Anaerolineae bacterium]